MKTIPYSIRLVIVALLFIVNGILLGSEDTNCFYSPFAGFTITKPKDWQFASVQQVATNRANIRLKDKELEELIKHRASKPLAVILKHPQTYDDLNPTVQVTMRPLGQLEGKSAVELMHLAIPSLQRGMSDFSIIDQPKETKVRHLPAAYLKAKFTVGNPEGREFKILTRMWVVPRGKLMFIIGMSGPQEGLEVSEKEFSTILDSIKIDE